MSCSRAHHSASDKSRASDPSIASLNTTEPPSNIGKAYPIIIEHELQEHDIQLNRAMKQNEENHWRKQHEEMHGVSSDFVSPSSSSFSHFKHLHACSVFQKRVSKTVAMAIVNDARDQENLHFKQERCKENN